MRSHRIVTRFAFALAPLVLGAALAGCTGQVPLGVETDAVAQLPDCAVVSVGAEFQAEPAGGKLDSYVVRRGAEAVCTTDFEGLELLAARADGSQPVPLVRLAPAASDPMPGRGNDPAASDPMPGRGSNPAASDPMPGRNPNAVVLAAEAAYTR